VIERTIEVTRVRGDKWVPTTQKLLRLCAAPERQPRARQAKARVKTKGRR
jgi:hypothetical protein